MTDQRNVSGVLLFDKPAGVTSHDIIYRVRRLYGTKKVGHTGTLDPMATGLLVVLVGRAAKAAEYLTADSKTYIAEMTLGITTDTEDSSGAVLTRSGDIPGEEEVSEAAASFAGRIKQIPPMYSAIKKNGRKLVDLARKGIEVERLPRDAEIYSLEIKKLTREKYLLTAHVSKGTYIRTLCADIGRKLGCGAVMSGLRRTASGGFSVENAYTEKQLADMSEAERISVLIPVEALFADLPKVVLPEFFCHLATSGNEIYQKKIGTAYAVGQRVALYGKEGFFALGQVMDFEDGSAVKPVKQFVIQ